MGTLPLCLLLLLGVDSIPPLDDQPSLPEEEEDTAQERLEPAEEPPARSKSPLEAFKVSAGIAPCLVGASLTLPGLVAGLGAFGLVCALLAGVVPIAVAAPFTAGCGLACIGIYQIAPWVVPVLFGASAVNVLTGMGGFILGTERDKRHGPRLLSRGWLGLGMLGLLVMPLPCSGLMAVGAAAAAFSAFLLGVGLLLDGSGPWEPLAGSALAAVALAAGAGLILIAGEALTPVAVLGMSLLGQLDG